jgi:hypothetical protein
VRQEGCVVAAGIGVRWHGHAGYGGNARKHSKQSHRFIVVEIGGVVLPSLLAESIRDICSATFCSGFTLSRHLVVVFMAMSV